MATKCVACESRGLSKHLRPKMEERDDEGEEGEAGDTRCCVTSLFDGR